MTIRTLLLAFLWLWGCLTALAFILALSGAAVRFLGALCAAPDVAGDVEMENAEAWRRAFESEWERREVER